MAVNTNRQGAQFELDIMHYLAGCTCRDAANPRHVGWDGFGYDALRSSGSKGAVDVVAVGPRPEGAAPDILFIQAKITNPVIPPAERIRLLDLALRADALPLVAYKVRDMDTGRKRPHFRILTGPGPKEWAIYYPGKGWQL